ncbi:MAG: prepilin peptidase [Patescibacteria group bacterium]
MTTVTFVFFLIFGAIIGSFLNVFIIRHNTGRSLRGRSACASCGEKLLWYELIPVASFFMLRGKCRACKSRISPQYPLVETTTAIAFLLIGNNFLSGLISAERIVFSLYEMVLWALLIAISTYDIRHKIIPNGPVYAFIGLSALSLFGFLDGWGTFLFSHFFAGIGLALFPATAWFLSRGRWMGLGDAKVLLGAGFLLGPALGISALVYAFWIGAIVSLFLLSTRGKEFTMKSEIPFGPFIVLGMAIAYFLNLDLFSFLL